MLAATSRTKPVEPPGRRQASAANTVTPSAMISTVVGVKRVSPSWARYEPATIATVPMQIGSTAEVICAWALRTRCNSIDPSTIPTARNSMKPALKNSRVTIT